MARLPRLLKQAQAVLVQHGRSDGFYVAAPVAGQTKLARIFVKVDGEVRMPARRGHKRQNATANVVWSASLVDAANLRSAADYRLI